MRQEIIKRYTTESACCDNLSCGSNLDFLNITAGEKILDLGCGRGRETIEAAQLTGRDGLAVGLDITDAMLREATRASKEAGAANTRFVVGDIEALPFDSNFFDAVMSNCVINHTRDKVAAYREIYRVLKNGGRFVVSDAVTKSPLPDSVKNDPEAWAQCFGGAVTEQEYLESVHKAGFEEIIILKRREYVKNNYDFISLTMMAVKYDA
ncbi:methyltransferase domain-containing protein [Oscillospiraceae bacterium CM]|nr:methyltransferase domain-containing protein [Oscillospiraceae bacterium CM]